MGFSLQCNAVELKVRNCYLHIHIEYLCSPVVLEYLSWQDIPNPRVKPHQVTSAELSEHLKRNKMLKLQYRLSYSYAVTVVTLNTHFSVLNIFF